MHLLKSISCHTGYPALPDGLERRQRGEVRLRASGCGRRRIREAAAQNARALQQDDTRERVPPADGHPDVPLRGGHVQQDRRRLLHAPRDDVEGLPEAAAAAAAGIPEGRGEVPGAAS